MCDLNDDCLDNSEEIDCPMFTDLDEFFNDFRQPPPAIVLMRGSQRDEVTVKAIKATSPCPVTHFRCPQPVYCLPVFLRCNRVKDCPYGEDEVGCETMVCPGYYRCRGSSVCLHPSNICDSTPQCPQRDDELLCEASCPSVCQCQGLAFVCYRSFPAANYPDLRYLDAKRSDITPLSVSDNLYLINLNLASCQLTSWPETHLNNLQSLDLSHNNISVVWVWAFYSLKNLRYLCLKGNPLHKVVTDSSNIQQTSLLHVDVSFTHLQQFDSSIFVNFPFIQVLNLSFSAAKNIYAHGFMHLPKLKHLDLRGCRVTEFSRDVYVGLTELQSIKAESYRLCCKVILPETFNEDFCHAPSDEISSCEDLLQSSLYRSAVWIVGILSLAGNSGSFVYRLCHSSASGYGVFVTNLSVSDFVMGLYLTIIGIADNVYRGAYLWHENDWKDSVLCKIAGFLCMLSNEVSTFTICFITIDCFLVTHFPFTAFRFKGTSAVIASGLAWLFGVFLAAVPLFSVFSRWHFYGHTGVCIPLTVQRKTLTGHLYLFRIVVVFNFTLSIIVAVGQMFIYRKMKRRPKEPGDLTRLPKDITVARRLFTVVISDFFCWFSIGVLGLLDFNDTPVPGQVSGAMTIIVLPLNSALNPFLYTVNVLMEKKRRAREARLLKMLQARAAAQHLAR